MKKVLSLVLCILMIVSMVPAVFAAESLDANNDALREVSREVIYFEDGTSIVIVDYESTVVPAGGVAPLAANTITKTKGYIQRDALGTELYELKLTATFNYNGAFAYAVSATYSYEIYQNLYRFGSAYTSYSENYATATGTFYDSLGTLHKTLRLTMTCDMDGNITVSYN